MKKSFYPQQFSSFYSKDNESNFIIQINNWRVCRTLIYVKIEQNEWNHLNTEYENMYLNDISELKHYSFLFDRLDRATNWTLFANYYHLLYVINKSNKNFYTCNLQCIVNIHKINELYQKNN